jgi:hypothetical protein
MPIVVPYPITWVAEGVKETSQLVAVIPESVLWAKLAAMATEARAEDVPSPPRAELSPAAQTFGDGKPRFHAPRLACRNAPGGRTD